MVWLPADLPAIVRTGSLVRASTAMNVNVNRYITPADPRGRAWPDSSCGRKMARPSPPLELSFGAMPGNDSTLAPGKTKRPPPGIDAIAISAYNGAAGTLFFESLRRTRPSIALSVWQGDDSASPNGWPTGLLMLPSPCPPPGQAGRSTLGADRLCLVGTEPDRPIRHDPGYIYVEAGPDFEREHTTAYADADTAKISFNNASWALVHLRQHGGSAYLPHRLVAPEIDAEACLPDGAPDFQRPVSWSSATAQTPTPMISQRF